MRSLPLILGLLPLVGCASPAPSAADEDPLGLEAGVALLEGKADGATSGELRVRTANLTVWLNVRGRTDHEGPTGSRLIISGRASRDLASVSSWVPDDAFGEVVLEGKRKFELVLDEPHEINTALSGAPLYLAVTSKTGAHRDYHVRLALEPRLVDFAGSRAIYLRDAVLPVFVRDGLTDLRYRGLATVAEGPTWFSVGTDDDGDPVVARADDTHFEFDWTYSALALAMTPTTDPVYFSAGWDAAPARHESKTAHLVPVVAKLAITASDPYDDLVLTPSCAPSVLACIAEQSGADDLGACGTYRDVRVCLADGPVCGEDSADLELFEIPVDLSLGLATFSAAGAHGGADGWLDAARFYRLPECLEALPDVGGLAAMVASMNGTAGEAWPVLEDGGRDEVLGHSPLAMAPAEAAALLAELDARAGSLEARYWLGETEVPCQNCHEWEVVILAYYPEVGRLFVLRGGYFWDS